MPQQPTLEMYLQRHADYQQFIALVVAVGAVLAWQSIRTGRGRGLRVSWPLWAIVSAATGVRLPLMTQDFWYDETFTSLVVGGDWARLWTVVLGDVHPPLYYALVKLFSDTLGHTDLTMRLPALLSGVALVLAFYEIGKGHGGRRVGLWTATVIAIMPSAVWYSTEARYPAFLALMLALSYIGIQRRRWRLTSVALAVAAITHVNAWFYVVVLVGMAVLKSGRLRVAVLPGLAVGSWFPFALQQASDVADGFWIRQSVPVRYIVDMTITTRFPDWPLPLVVVIVGVGLGVIGVAVWDWRRNASWLWLVTVTVPPAAQWLTGEVWNPIYLERSLLFSALLLAVPVGWWLNYNARHVTALAGLLAVSLALLSVWTLDRSNADAALAKCDSPIVWAGNTYSAVLANHYTDAIVMTATNPNSTAQSLPASSRRVLWLEVEAPPPGACVFAQVDAYTTRNQLTQLQQLTDAATVETDTRYAYYLIDKRN